MQSNSLELQLSESIDSALEYSFIFETLGSKYKVIQAKNPIQVFDNFSDLDIFLEKNPDLLDLDHAGFAGYISYDGKCELALYENIKINQGAQEKINDLGKSFFAEINKPDPKLFIAAIKKCQEYIKEGDIYQANLAHKFIINKLNASGKEIYEKLKQLNPSPYAGYMNFRDYEIVSSSPESFLKIQKVEGDWLISSSPIKGTAKLNELNELMESSKERAEHIMIVDLIRNDLGRICKPGSIKADELMSIHKFKNLYHYISTIEGVLRHPRSNAQGVPKFSKIFSATFPGGSITGVPKKRCLEIIKELEPTPRELFTGSMGYFKFKEGGEFNILIRTLVHNKTNKEWSFHTGSGITAYSNPKKELEETFLKAEKLAEVFGVKL